jgi:uncharacterized protein YkwD
MTKSSETILDGACRPEGRGLWTAPRVCKIRVLMWALLTCSAGLAAMPSRADVLFAVRVLREGGCGGTLPAAPQLHRNALLDRSAQEWAAGRTLTKATDFSGYHAVSAAGLHVRGPDAAMLQLLERSGCEALTSQGFHEIGFYRRGFDTWIVLATEHEVTASAAPASAAPASAAPAVTPTPRSTSAAGLSPILATRTLQLVNNVRARGTRCGNELFGPAPPVSLSSTLGDVALGHADDMATNNYFEHEDLHGKSPSDRVRATGYQEKLVGENIAYGPKSVDEVVQGWLDSPGHCENIMDPRFVEMGIGYATSHDSKHALYWVQVLATPRNLAASARSEPR